MVASCHIRVVGVLLLLFLLQLRFSLGQGNECRNATFPPGSFCEPVESWEDFVVRVNETVGGDELYLCPFDVYKGDQPPLSIQWGISILCVRSDDLMETCTFRGSGTFINVDTDQYTLFHGLHFKDTNDYAVHVLSSGGAASGAIRTFCHCSFSGIHRTDSSRGGAFMTQENAGTVNLFYCYFSDNHSTRGAAVYTRTNQLNIVGSQFYDNSASEWGAAIYCAREGGLYIEGSTFSRNDALDDHSIAVQPSLGSSVWIDGGDNLSIDGNCTGFFLLTDKECQEFIGGSLSTMFSSEAAGTISPIPTMSPSFAPSSLAEGLCDFHEDDLPCIEVDTFTEIQEAVRASSEVVFCGGFLIQKSTEDFLELSGAHDIRCIVTCTISGTGTHVEISGSDSQVRLSNMKFTLSDSSAVRIETSSPNATTTFCQTEFWRNTANFGAGIFIARHSGFVNIVGSSFTNNEAVKGGAIYGGAKQLSIADSVFISNIAIKAGSAIFTFFESDVEIRSSYFALNTVSSQKNFALVVHGSGESQSSLQEGLTDAGGNAVVTSGECSGFYVQSTKACKAFGKKQFNHLGELPSPSGINETIGE